MRSPRCWRLQGCITTLILLSHKVSSCSVFSQINGVEFRLLFQRYHSFLLTGRIDHSAKLLRVITWNRSHTSEDDGADKDEFETHATVLDKMLAWEKKLYDEVKVKWILVLFFFIFYVNMWDYMGKFSSYFC